MPLIAIFALAIGYFASQALAPIEIKLSSGTWLNQTKDLPNFELISHNQKPINNTTLKNQWTLLFFGYTHCPDVCPDSLNMLNSMVEQLEKTESKHLKVIFVSVDPERDTLERLKQYVTYFNPNFIGATAEIPKILTLSKALGIVHYINKSESSYNVSHSGTMTLLNPQAQFNAVFSAPQNPAKLAQDLTQIISKHQ